MLSGNRQRTATEWTLYDVVKLCSTVHSERRQFVVATIVVKKQAPTNRPTAATTSVAWVELLLQLCKPVNRYGSIITHKKHALPSKLPLYISDGQKLTKKLIKIV